MRCRPRGKSGYTTTPAAAQLQSGPASPRRSTTCGRATPWSSGNSIGSAVRSVTSSKLVGGLQAKGIGLKVLTGGIDTTSSTGRLVFGIFATLAEFERDLIRERTIAGLAAARARGRNGGRPRLMTRAKLRTARAMMADRGNVAADIAEQLGISLSTLYAYVDGEGRPKPCATKLLGR